VAVGLLLGAAVPAGTMAGAANAHITSPPAVASPGCALAPAAASSTTTPFTAAGHLGDYVAITPGRTVHAPPLPVIIDLHGWSESAAVQTAASGWGAYGMTHGFMTVTPEIHYAVPHWDVTLGSHDLAYLAALMTHLERTSCLDERRIFVTGYSDGAFMTSSVACQLASRVAAVGMVAGIESPTHCRPTRPVPAVAFHGTADPYVAYGGGQGPKALALPAADGSGKTLGQEESQTTMPRLPPIPATTAAWAARNHCNPRPAVTAVARGVTLLRYACPKNATVELYRITGGGHAWPGSTFTASISSAVGFTTMAIDADAIMWHFFEAHPLPR
jgi:polyhydroxybutyrate depolymerase